MPLTEQGEIIFVNQFRYALGKVTLEVPAGKLEKGEDPLECGRRELEEETGFKASEFVSLGYLYPSPGFANETTHIFLAWGLTEGAVNRDEDEFMNVIELSPAEIYDKIIKNEITDAKTVIGFFKGMEYMKNN